MDIIKRLFLVLQWLAFLPFLLGLSARLFLRDTIGVMEAGKLAFPYLIIILIRWILFKEWILLPWQKKCIIKDD